MYIALFVVLWQLHLVKDKIHFDQNTVRFTLTWIQVYSHHHYYIPSSPRWRLFVLNLQGPLFLSSWLDYGNLFQHIWYLFLCTHTSVIFLHWNITHLTLVNTYIWHYSTPSYIPGHVTLLSVSSWTSTGSFMWRYHFNW